jgi:hypothetical protein
MAILLSGVMLLNICKYQLPYIEYLLFKDYIADNLCIKRYEANNDCRGKCFLYEQIDMTVETDNTANSTAEKQQITFDDYVIKEFILQKPLFSETHLISFVNTYVSKVYSDVPVPPPRDF